MTTSLFELFQRGGPVMWPILLCSIVGLAIVLERLIALFRIDEESPRFLSQVTELLKKRELAKARLLCEQTHTPLSRIVKAGMHHYGRPPEEIHRTIEETASLEVTFLERTLPLLGTIAHVAPLLGLLGTVTGLIRCFQVIQEKATSVNPVNPGDLAGGIWEALLTTVFGLLIAIPAYTLYNYLVYRINRLVNYLHHSAIQLVPLMSGEAGWSVAQEPVTSQRSLLEETKVQGSPRALS